MKIIQFYSIRSSYAFFFHHSPKNNENTTTLINFDDILLRVALIKKLYNDFSLKKEFLQERIKIQEI